ncbi:hypothetical protein EVAR_82131_1 [Eumeta japonica]|uniref:Uncharacterized protein n=1 Tax=Eumeta variegata TaxID=151549 RepID=A0A4C1U1Y7_EUMVA|nr:hypothetical protein EVAR_82131_1 [Eumeta japonica]
MGVSEPTSMMKATIIYHEQDYTALPIVLENAREFIQKRKLLNDKAFLFSFYTFLKRLPKTLTTKRRIAPQNISSHPSRTTDVSKCISELRRRAVGTRLTFARHFFVFMNTQRPQTARPERQQHQRYARRGVFPTRARGAIARGTQSELIAHL